MSPPPWDYIAKLVCIGDSGTGKSSLTIRLCEGRFTATHDVTIGVEFGSRIVPVGPPASDALDISDTQPTSSSATSKPAVAATTTSPDDANDNDSNDNTHANGLSAGLPPPPQKKATAPPVQKRMKLSLWDTAGQETYKSITRSYFRGASGALLVFDITRRSTFTSLTQWLQDLHQIAEEGIVVVLVGNKSDLANGSSVDNENQTQTHNRSGRDEGGNDDTAPNRRQVTRAEAEEWCRVNNVVRYVETSAKSGEGVERAFLEAGERIYRNIQADRYDLNDRRSGVKGYRTTAGGGGGGTRVERTVSLGLNDAMRSGRGSWTGGCC